MEWDIEAAKLRIMAKLASNEASRPDGEGIALTSQHMGKDDPPWIIASPAIEALISERMAEGKPVHTFKSKQAGSPFGFERLRLTDAGLALISNIKLSG